MLPPHGLPESCGFAGVWFLVSAPRFRLGPFKDNGEVGKKDRRPVGELGDQPEIAAHGAHEIKRVPA
jgi:hypothetical protein